MIFWWLIKIIHFIAVCIFSLCVCASHRIRVIKVQSTCLMNKLVYYEYCIYQVNYIPSNEVSFNKFSCLWFAFTLSRVHNLLQKACLWVFHDSLIAHVYWMPSMVYFYIYLVNIKYRENWMRIRCLCKIMVCNAYIEIK